MENKEIKRSAAELNDEELENIAGGVSMVTVSGVICSQCGVTINGMAYEDEPGTYKCTNCRSITIPKIL